jgi:hypothetical protein
MIIPAGYQEKFVEFYSLLQILLSLLDKTAVIFNQHSKY